MWEAKNKTAIVGVGYSQIGRGLERSLGMLALDACNAAVSDAGLRWEDIDGVATYPDLPAGGHSITDGVDIVSIQWMIQALQLQPQIAWWTQTSPGMISGAVANAVNALAAGSCSYVLVWRALHMPKGSYSRYDSNLAPGDAQFTAPYGLGLAPMNFAPTYMRYQKMFGATREHMATFIVNNRSNANKNPRAYFYKEPLTKEDYMNSRMIADPMCLYDCDIPVDGVSAIVLTTADRARSMKNPPAYITGWGQSPWMAGGVGAIEAMWNNAEAIGESLWKTSGLSPKDVDGAMLYDGFSPDIYFWLEGLGFCQRGEAFRYIQDGRIEIGGELPINTFGGNLSEGRLHGMGHIAEAANQVMGRADQRQIAGAENIAVAVGMLSMGTGFIVSKNPLR